MALPTTGSLSLKAAAGTTRSIANEVDGNLTGNKSLSSLSVSAGKSAPHSMLEFYGYTSVSNSLSVCGIDGVATVGFFANDFTTKCVDYYIEPSECTPLLSKIPLGTTTSTAWFEIDNLGSLNGVVCISVFNNFGVEYRSGRVILTHPDDGGIQACINVTQAGNFGDTPEPL